jgi:hypothetical protein
MENVYFMAIGNILQKFGVFHSHLVYFVVICMVYFPPVLVWFPEKNLATLIRHACCTILEAIIDF